MFEIILNWKYRPQRMFLPALTSPRPERHRKYSYLLTSKLNNAAALKLIPAAKVILLY